MPLIGTHELQLEGPAEDIYRLIADAVYLTLVQEQHPRAEELANRIITRVELRLTAAGHVTRQIASDDG